MGRLAARSVDSSFQWFLDGGKLKHWEEGVKHSPASGGDKLWNWEEASLFCATEDSASPGTDARGPLGRLPMPLSAEENELIRQHAIKAKLGQGVQRNSGGALADQDYIWLGGYMLEGQTGLWGRKCARRDGYTLTEGYNDQEGANRGYNADAYDPLTFGSWVWNDAFDPYDGANTMKTKFMGRAPAVYLTESAFNTYSPGVHFRAPVTGQNCGAPWAAASLKRCTECGGSTVQNPCTTGCAGNGEDKCVGADEMSPMSRRRVIDCSRPPACDAVPVGQPVGAAGRPAVRLLGHWPESCDHLSVCEARVGGDGNGGDGLGGFYSAQDDLRESCRQGVGIGQTEPTPYRAPYSNWAPGYPKSVYADHELLGVPSFQLVKERAYCPHFGIWPTWRDVASASECAKLAAARTEKEGGMKYFNFGRKGTEKEGVCTVALTNVPSCDDLKAGGGHMEFQRLGGDEDFYQVREGYGVDQEQQAFVVAMRLSTAR